MVPPNYFEGGHPWKYSDRRSRELGILTPRELGWFTKEYHLGKISQTEFN